jgi:hypothetical protein
MLMQKLLEQKSNGPAAQDPHRFVRTKNKAIVAVIKDCGWIYTKGEHASDRTHDGRHRQRDTEISHLKLTAIHHGH